MQCKLYVFKLAPNTVRSFLGLSEAGVCGGLHTRTRIRSNRTPTFARIAPVLNCATPLAPHSIFCQHSLACALHELGSSWKASRQAPSKMQTRVCVNAAPICWNAPLAASLLALHGNRKSGRVAAWTAPCSHSAASLALHSNRPSVRVVAELTTTEPAAKELAAKAVAAKEPAAKELAAKEPAAKELAAKELAAKEPAAKDPAAKEPAAKEPAAKEPAAKAAAATEPAAKEPASKAAAATTIRRQRDRRLADQVHPLFRVRPRFGSSCFKSQCSRKVSCGRCGARRVRPRAARRCRRI